MTLQVRGLFIVALAIASVFFTPLPAHAVVNDVTCTAGQVLINWTPGIKATPVQPVDFDGSGTLGACVLSGGTAVPGAALTNLNGSGNISCLTSNNVAGSFKLTWQDTGEISQVNLTSLTPMIGSVSKIIVLNGTVHSGRFAGDTVNITLAATVSDTTQCLSTNGLEHSSSTVTTMTIM